MSIVRLPPVPTSLVPLNPVRVGNAARLELGGAALHVLPELMVARSLGDLVATATEFQVDPHVPGTATGAGWRVWAAPEGIEAALQGRRISIDAIGLSDDGIIDPLGGQECLATGTLELPEINQQDPLVGLRAIALAAECRIELSPEQLARIADKASDIFYGDRHLVRYWLTRLLCSARPSEALGDLQKTRLLSYMLPELEVMVGFHRSSRHHHKDIWAHTCQVVQQAVPRPLIRWAALLHDIGKVATRSYTEKGKVHFLRHDDVGAYMFEGIAIRLGFPEDFAEQIRLLILHHLRPAMYHDDWSEAAVRRFINRTDPVTDDLLDLARADITSKRKNTRKRAIANVFALRQRVAELRAQEQQAKIQIPTGLGRAIIDQLGVAPGPRVGDLRKLCEAAVRAGDLAGDADIEECIAYLKAEHAA